MVHIWVGQNALENLDCHLAKSDERIDHFAWGFRIMFAHHIIVALNAQVQPCVRNHLQNSARLAESRAPGLLGGVTTRVHLLKFHHRDPGLGHGGLQLVVSEHLGNEAHVGNSVEHRSVGSARAYHGPTRESITSTSTFARL